MVSVANCINIVGNRFSKALVPYVRQETSNSKSFSLSKFSLF